MNEEATVSTAVKVYARQRELQEIFNGMEESGYADQINYGKRCGNDGGREREPGKWSSLRKPG